MASSLLGMERDGTEGLDFLISRTHPVAVFSLLVVLMTSALVSLFDFLRCMGMDWLFVCPVLLARWCGRAPDIVAKSSRSSLAGQHPTASATSAEQSAYWMWASTTQQPQLSHITRKPGSL